jgi:outer membrane receptor protein involved in Fe transport
VRFAFDLNDDVNLYASAATGFKATSWNLSRDTKPFAGDLGAVVGAGLGVPNLVSGTRFAAPEEATVYELGLKARLERGSINIAVFDQTIENFQSNIFTGTAFSLANAGEQSTVGLEFDGTYYPTDALKLTLAATWLDPLYDSFAGAQGPAGPVDLSGTEPAGIHPLSAVASGTYTMDFAGGRSGFARLEFLHESDVQVVENIAESVASREVSVWNASLGLSTDSGWDITLWGRNLTDDEFLLSAAPGVFQAGSFSGYPNPPRTYGITARKMF